MCLVYKFFSVNHLVDLRCFVDRFPFLHYHYMVKINRNEDKIMLNEKMVALGTQRSVIRELFEYGKQRAAEVGAENVFDFSIGNRHQQEHMLRLPRPFVLYFFSCG